MSHESVVNQQRHNVVVGVTGGVAAFKAVLLVRELQRRGFSVRVAMTPSAAKFVSPIQFESLTKTKVLLDPFDSVESGAHVELGGWADAMVVAPATTATISRLANGLSDDGVVLTFMCCKGPRIIAPAMHEQMLHYFATRKNLEKLEEAGCLVVSPEQGALAGGDTGEGRLANVDTIVSQIEDVLVPKTRHRFIVTSGGTREPIDPVRFIGNRSSGKQGNEIALALALRGIEVDLITSSLNPPKHPRINIFSVSTAEEMHALVMQKLPNAHGLIMAAAVADYRPKEVSAQKLKKDLGDRRIDLVRTKDILTDAVKNKPDGCLIVGFAAETQDALENGTEKLRKKGLDMVVINDVSSLEKGFEVDLNEAWIIDRSGNTYQTGLISKKILAEKVAELSLNKMK